MTTSTEVHDTPMLRQYRETKALNPDALLFIRMGDFYEIFLEDATVAAEVLGITLTARHKGKANETPMAGVPHRSLEGYLPKLLERGYKVAIMDQLEDPATAQGLVKRGLTRVITPGTLLDESALEDGTANYLVALTGLEHTIGIAALDCSTGEFLIEHAATRQELALALARFNAAEIIISDSLDKDEHTRKQIAELHCVSCPTITAMPDYAWRAEDARRHLSEHLHVSSLEGFGISESDDHLAAAAAAALRYASEHAFNSLTHIRSIRRLYPNDHLIMDAVCQRNLDLLRNSRDNSRNGTLLQCVDHCRSAAGSRLLASWIARPLADVAAITARHDGVEALLSQQALCHALREKLQSVYDLERLLTRIATGRCHGRDLVQLANTLQASMNAQQLLINPSLDMTWPAIISETIPHLNPAPDLSTLISDCLVDEPPLGINEGGMVRDGYDHELDELRVLKRDAGEWLAAYQARECERCQIPKMKVGYNRIIGYFIEISKLHSDKVPDDFIRKQTLVSAERYITPELKEYEERALGAEDSIRSRELEIFSHVRSEAESMLGTLQSCAHGLASLDVLCSFADNAQRLHWCRPVIDNSARLTLTDARHPVVERVIGREHFVANNCSLDASARGESARGESARDENTAHHFLALITGPNMAGKSTYIRQVALAVVLAQAGSYVPAQSAHIGIVDRLFTRVGAGDELSRNMSTFMVEMAETAAILNNATDRSLVILDEVGRGTSTYDGVSLAWAITEHLHNQIACRCLFATHYHELCALEEQLAGVGNLTVAIAEKDDTVVFLHRIIAGAATKSYGIHVAQLAGIPPAVIKRAHDMLEHLEDDRSHTPAPLSPAIPAPAAASPAPAAVCTDTRVSETQLSIFDALPSPTMQELMAVRVDDCTPREALDILFRLQERARNE